MGKFLKLVNSEFIILVFKKNKFFFVKDFRFVVCCIIFYKMIVRILIGRMKNVVDFLVGFI